MQRQLRWDEEVQEVEEEGEQEVRGLRGLPALRRSPTAVEPPPKGEMRNRGKEGCEGRWTDRLQREAGRKETGPEVGLRTEERTHEPTCAVSGVHSVGVGGECF